ncbi:MAG: L-arabinose isomerase family protein [Anaerolineae bacterium]
MPTSTDTKRYLKHQPLPHLQKPAARLQPVLAKPGKPSVDVDHLRRILAQKALIGEMIPIRSPEHWREVVLSMDDGVDAILPFSIPAYPTEIWNSHPQPLVERGLPVVFWSLIEHDEPDFWRLAARDMLRTLGVEVHVVQNNEEGIALVNALAMKRFLSEGKLVVFGEQNFPWNANAVGDRVTQHLGTEIVVRPLADIRARYAAYSDAEVRQVWQTRQGERYVKAGVHDDALVQAVRTYLAIRDILEEERALGFGVNCFGDLIIKGGRDVPCLAQLLLREDGYVAACDGDFIAMISMALSTYFLGKPCMTSNLYPVSYVGALADHFGDPLSPDERYPRSEWTNIARMAHCGFVGVVSPEMTPEGRVDLQDWGGTYEIKRDGRGCGIDGDLIAGMPVTVHSLGFSADRLMVTRGEVLETTRHAGMPHCESSLLLKLSNLPDFFEAVSRDHVIVQYGDHVRDFEILADVLGLEFSAY